MADPDVKWTAKGPTLTIGIGLILTAFIALHRKCRACSLVAAILFFAGAGFIGYSLKIKEWCAARDVPHSAFASGFGGSFHQCLRKKSWLEL